MSAAVAAAAKGKVCAVFGFGPGIGAAAARKWSTNGYQVALLARQLDKLRAAEADIPNSRGFACDVTDSESVKAAVTAIQSELGPIDTVIYNAGSGAFKTWDKIELSELDRGFKTCVYGLLQVTQLVAPSMLERGTGGAIMVTGATSSLRGKPFTTGFAPAKGAQRMLAQSLARDLHPKGVHVGLFIIDGGIGKDDSDPSKLDPNAIAETYWHVANQPKSCWSFETEVRPSVENW
jgi:NADP-dependent 3-hydroxy acid dehydrogenase YdfG